MFPKRLFKLCNGNGLVSSLDSKEAKCNMLFAVHTVKREQREFAITYGKQAVPSKCECNTSMKPTLDPTTTMTTPQEPSTTTHPPTAVQSPTTTEETTTTREEMTTPVTPSTAATSKKHTTKKEISNTLKNIETLKTTKPTDPYDMNHGDFAHRQLQPGTPDGTISECISNV
ncbi:Hypothetical predicted protein [Paramuricea clavata]|uniref:Uncharacterized protein n=1 Tax=Paramuricea clavata TaxID=317549 RepID=A0A7D9I6X2_PARCT|nr:Hypothetical predicted protein [Paramuricea clavata]